MFGQRFVKEAADRVTIIWDISEPSATFRTSPGHHLRQFGV
jgi:hypothetical protein